jgi:hypothetical protein
VTFHGKNAKFGVTVDGYDPVKTVQAAARFLLLIMPVMDGKAAISGRGLNERPAVYEIPQTQPQTT